MIKANHQSEKVFSLLSVMIIAIFFMFLQWEIIIIKYIWVADWCATWFRAWPPFSEGKSSWTSQGTKLILLIIMMILGCYLVRIGVFGTGHWADNKSIKMTRMVMAVAERKMWLWWELGCQKCGGQLILVLVAANHYDISLQLHGRRFHKSKRSGSPSSQSFGFSELELSFYPFDTMMTLEWQTVIKRTKAWRHFEGTDCNGRTNPCFGDFLALLGTRGQEALMRGTLVSIQCIPVMARVVIIIIRIVRIYTVRGNQEN